jgi:hypothetical protein
MKRLNMKICFTCKKTISVVEDEFDYSKPISPIVVEDQSNYHPSFHSEELDDKCDECHNNLHLLQAKSLDIKDKVTGESLTTTEYSPIREMKCYNGRSFIDPKVQTKKVIKDPSVRADLKKLMKERIAASKILRKTK